jgi:hypothetical protein
MGRKAILSGVQPKGKNRIQFDFEFGGKRYRPTVTRIPSEANLRRAHKQLQDIKARIAAGTFKLDEEFPEYRYMSEVDTAEVNQERTCDQVFDEGYCRWVLDDKGKVIPGSNPDYNDRKLQLRAACEAFDIDTHDPCGLSVRAQLSTYFHR